MLSTWQVYGWPMLLTPSVEFPENEIPEDESAQIVGSFRIESEAHGLIVLRTKANPSQVMAANAGVAPGNAYRDTPAYLFQFTDDSTRILDLPVEDDLLDLFKTVEGFSLSAGKARRVALLSPHQFLHRMLLFGGLATFDSVVATMEAGGSLSLAVKADTSMWDQI